MKLLRLLLALVGLSSTSDGGSVLLFAPFLSKSVTITFVPLLKELASRGHQVPILPNTFFSNFTHTYV
jgi:hypothetical protein